MVQLPARSVLAAFAATVFIGGANFVVIKFSNAELPPLFGAGLRFAFAALIFLGIMKLRGMKAPTGRALAGAALYGALTFGMVYGLLYFALLRLPSGMTSLIMAAVPLATLVLAVMSGQEKFTPRTLSGGVLALAGIAVLSSPALVGAVELLPLLAVVAAMLSAAGSAVLVKGFPKSHPVTTNAVGMGVGSAALLLASAVAGEPWAPPRLGTTWLALTWLVVIGSVGLFAMFVFMIKRWTASASAYSLTMMPVVSVLLGAILLNEVVTWHTVGGASLVISGIYVGALSGQRLGRKRPATQAGGRRSRRSRGALDAGTGQAVAQWSATSPPLVPEGSPGAAGASDG